MVASFFTTPVWSVVKLANGQIVELISTGPWMFIGRSLSIGYDEIVNVEWSQVVEVIVQQEPRSWWAGVTSV